MTKNPILVNKLFNEKKIFKHSLEKFPKKPKNPEKLKIFKPSIFAKKQKKKSKTVARSVGSSNFHQ